MENTYLISNLSCGYRPEEIVLEIDHLAIPRGKLIFVVGVSGGGKSTLIETLGLMNHTTRYAGGGGRVIFQPTAATGELDLLRQWDLSDARRSDFRKKHFSFIFQNTNLMPNFSTGENMLITALLAGSDEEAAKLRIKQLMERIGLPPRAFSTKVQLLSGGQRQRLAFIRALVADYTVLFGDEPTGNLDEATARECFSLLRAEISENKTGIIVSHDLKLAIDFADLIVPISLGERGGKSYGRVVPKNILYARQDRSFHNEQNEPIGNPLEYLRRIIFVNNGLS